MTSEFQFVLSVLLAASIAILIAFKTPAKAYRRLVKTERGQGILKGIVFFIAFGAVFALTSMAVRADSYEPPKWFTYSEVYLGLDYTKNVSNFCHPGGDDDKATSNGGLRQNVYRSPDKRFHLNAKYTHHSCAFNVDRPTYDAFGVELVYRFHAR